MTKSELAILAKRKDEFLQEMVHKHGLALEYIVRLLKAKNVVYNKAKEGEIDSLIEEVINKEVERKRAELAKRIKATPWGIEEPCWLSKHEAIMCTGHIVRDGGLPKCSSGGLAHYFATRAGVKNVVVFLQKYNGIKYARTKQIEHEKKTYFEEVAKPFDISKYQTQESYLE